LISITVVMVTNITIPSLSLTDIALASAAQAWLSITPDMADQHRPRQAKPALLARLWVGAECADGVNVGVEGTLHTGDDASRRSWDHIF
jgi:hypothetical protein